MKDTTIEARLAELESRLAFQDITIEELNQTVTAHELEMAKLRDHMRLLTEKLKATQPSNIASRWCMIPSVTPLNRRSRHWARTPRCWWTPTTSRKP